MSSLLSMRDVAKHNTPNDCWIVIHGKVYNITSFISEHPGGELPLLACAGKEATKEFAKIHAPSIVKLLSNSALIGDVDSKTIKDSDIAVIQAKHESTVVPGEKPPLEHILNIYDFESIASKVMDKAGWDYYSSGADDEITLRENHSAFQRIWLKPRVLVDVSTVDTSTTILGHKSSLPLYITSTALGKLAHPDGEIAITRAAYNEGVIQMCPTLASCSLDEMISAKQPGQVQFYQLYVNGDRQVTYDIVKKAELGGCKALCITVDAPRLGKRERDMRNKFSAKPPDLQKKDTINRNQGTARALSKFIDPSLSWNDIAWFKSITNMPIILKGIQCAEDAILSLRHGVQGIILSNHGGRQLDFARSGIEILPEVISALRSVNAPKSFEVWIDGGVRRGSDIFKALALGATAVGIGRPTLYGLAAYGQAGVEHVIRILREELEMCMGLMGVTSVEDVRGRMDLVCTRSLGEHVTGIPLDYLNNDTYQKLKTVGFSKL